jgi:hypothetical protein
MNFFPITLLTHKNLWIAGTLACALILGLLQHLQSSDGALPATCHPELQH